MLAALQIPEEDWLQAPVSVRTALATLWQHLLRLNARCSVYAHQVERLQAEAADLKPLQAEVAELRERLGLNSRNSSTSPSADSPRQRRRRKHEPSGRKVGGQPGHPSHLRRLKPENEVSRIIDLRPECCAQCGCLIPRGNFGPRVQATVAFLTGRIGASHRDVVEVMQTVHGVEVSVGTIPAIQQQVSTVLERPVQAVQAYVQRQAVNYVAETSWPESGQSHWLWVNAAEQATLFRVFPGRGTEQAKQVIGPAYARFAATDRYGAYNWLGNQRRQICWAHLKREFQRFVDRGGESEAVGSQLLREVREMFALWHQARGGKLTRGQFKVAIKPAQGRVGGIVAGGN